LRGALGEAPAAEGRKGIAAEQGGGAGKPVGQVADGMAGHCQDIGPEIAEPEGFAALVRDVDGGNAISLGGRPMHGAAGGSLDRRRAARIVMMGDDDMPDGPALRAGQSHDRPGIGWIDNGAVAAGAIMQEEGVVTSEGGNDADPKRMSGRNDVA